jgi:hypothetical protein
MAEPTKSVLLVDYDSVQRSLADSIGEARLAERAVAWLAALESGRLLGDDGNRRRMIVKRCYVGPSVRGKPRDALAAAGFEIVEAAESGARNAADLHIAMDTVELLTRGEKLDEFIVLSAGTDLKPLLSRLKSAGRATAIYTDDATSDTDTAAADLVLEAADFARFLNAEPKSAPPEPKPTPAAAAPSASSERAGIEAFARRIHAATNIPLFSPKTYAELFRHLTDEISANGYHFQSTAKNVAERMVAGGRSVNRRQVVFIVKGLALKGHVFSTSDTPERLAEVFREQARYLIGNAGISLTDHEENLLSAWFLSRPPPSTLAKAAPQTTAAPAPLPEAPPAAKAAIAETIEREVSKVVIKPPAPDKAKAAPRTPVPPRAQPVRPVDLPKSTAAAKPVPLPSAREEAKAVIAARIAGAAKIKPVGTRTPLPAKPAPRVPAPPAPPVEDEEMPATATAASAGRAQENAEALENSILAAIAEAVDVLVEDSAAEPEEAPEEADEAEEIEEAEEAIVEDDEVPPAAPRNASRVGRPAPEPEPEDDAESGDIGDQIQRIIASYNRNRGDE